MNKLAIQWLTLYLVLLPVCLWAADATSEDAPVLGSSESRLIENTYVDVYRFVINDQPGNAVFNLSSNAFDTNLIILDPEGKQYMDDDSGGGTNSMLVLNDMLPGVWQVLVTSYSAGEAGEYRLTIDPDQDLDLTRDMQISDEVLIISLQDRFGGGDIAYAEAAAGDVFEEVLVSAESPQLPRSREPAAESAGPEEIAQFPWPPPPASATLVLRNEQLVSTGSATLADVDNRLKDALMQSGYLQSSYYSVSGGYVLVTRIEQTDETGQPLMLPDRWSIEMPPMEGFSLGAYLRALFSTEVGHFRILVFAVTDIPFRQTGASVSRSEALAWFGAGYNVLPAEIGDMDYTVYHHTTVLVYEFEKARGARDVEVNVPGRLDGATHLRQSGVLSVLGD